MKFLIAAAVLVTLAFVGRAWLGMRGNRLVDRPIGTLATVRVPARLEPWAPTTNWLGTHFRLTRLIQSLLPGGNPTHHEDIEILQLAPRQLDRLGERALPYLFDALRSLEEISWEEPTRTGGKMVQHGSAWYRTGSIDQRARLVRFLDSARGVAIIYRSLERQGSRADAEALVGTILDSYQLATPVADHFGSVERELGGGIFISLPVEFYDPFMMEADSSGVRWMLYRHHPDAAEDSAVLERALAVAAFFAPGSAAQESAARAILRGEVLREATVTVEAEADTSGMEVSLVRHEAATGAQSAWLVTGFDVARGVGLTLRLWQHDASRAEAVAIVTRALPTYRFTGDPAWFAP